jgi:hypothetical protein
MLDWPFEGTLTEVCYRHVKKAEYEVLLETNKVQARYQIAAGWVHSPVVARQHLASRHEAERRPDSRRDGAL